MARKTDRLTITHHVAQMQCKVLDCKNQATVAIAYAWAPSTADAMEILPICAIHAKEIASYYED